MLLGSRPRHVALTLLLAFATGASATSSDDPAVRLPDHYEFDATLSAAFQPDASGRFPISLRFDYPAGGAATVAAWRLDVVSADGQIIKAVHGETALHAGRGSHRLTPWDGRDEKRQILTAGFYTLRLTVVPAVVLDSERDLPVEARVTKSFALAPEEVIEQSVDVRVGDVPAPVMPAFSGLPLGRQPAKAVAATASLPYTIYYGNLHSQTNHSDGGTAIADCNGSESPQAGVFGPADAYAMMDTQAGGDFLLASEHNHMYDGSTGTNTSANPATANNLFTSGMNAATTYNTAHPDFLALYGNEWGVISNGGHLNVINPDALPSWEYNSSSQLIGSVATIKSNYADLYAVMKARGWIGQFNHPTTSQFAIGGTGMAYHADGAEVMVLAEILNSSAFSTNTTETETGRSSYPGAFDRLLERGYKVAPSTNQDNHCANWGLSFRNRTGVLLPTSASLTTANFIDALKARRVFASEDKAAQLVLTADRAVMGQTVTHSGALTLTANYASSNGGTASRVQFFEGVPGRNGTVTQLFEGAGTYVFTPSVGAHFYYVKVTEADGDRLWSAPTWIDQVAAPSDTTPPSVSAAATGTTGMILLSATASDDVGVTNVEFYVDGVLKGNDTAAPYEMTLDSTTLSNGAHELTAKAFDAATNSALSSPFAFSVSNPAPDTTAPTVTATETGTSGTITLSASAIDDVGVTSVAFYIDDVLVGTDVSDPYAMTLDSLMLSNGAHRLTAQAFDAAGNQAISPVFHFTISNLVPDTTAPTVSASESGTSGMITLEATATDDVGVTMVEFYVEGALQGTDTTSPYSLIVDSTALANGPHDLVAKAHDASGNSAMSDAFAFSINNPVPDTTPPTVSAAAIGSSAMISLEATAADDVGVSQVEFYVDDVLVGTDATSPYAMTLDSTSLADGGHSLTAKAYDAAGNSALSTQFPFTIDTALPPVGEPFGDGFESD
jgi:hypothetical protein